MKDRKTWCATVHGVTKSQVWLSDWRTKVYLKCLQQCVTHNANTQCRFCDNNNNSVSSSSTIIIIIEWRSSSRGRGLLVASTPLPKVLEVSLFVPPAGGGCENVNTESEPEEPKPGPFPLPRQGANRPRSKASSWRQPGAVLASLI